MSAAVKIAAANSKSKTEKGATAVGEDYTSKGYKIIELNEGVIRDHLGEMVRSTVEETLNRMLDSEADRLCNAEKYQRSEARTDTRAGHYPRKLQWRNNPIDEEFP